MEETSKQLCTRMIKIMLFFSEDGSGITWSPFVEVFRGQEPRVVNMKSLGLPETHESGDS